MMKVLPTKVNEAPVGVWFWGFILVFNVVYVAVADWWLQRHNYEFMTTEFHEALQTSWGPMLLALWVGAFVGLTFHFIVAKP